MSSDNFIEIFKVDGKYMGYNRSASVKYPNRPLKREAAVFTADTLEEAVIKAQKEYTEYGYRFANLG